MSKIVLYTTSVSSSQEIKKRQQRITFILDGKKIAYEEVDIAQGEEVRNKMRDLAGDPKALPPQIFNGETYCGDFPAFDAAVEAENIEEFLKLK